MKKFTFLLVTLFTLSLIGQVKLTSTLHEYESAGVWMNSAKETFEYDSNKNLASKKVEFWYDDTLTWGYSELLSYSYDSNNLLKEEVFQHWDSYLDTPAFVNAGKSTYSYDSNNKLIEILSYYWQDDTWYITNKTNISYYSDGKKSGKISYMWNASDWTLLSRDAISYGDNGRVSKIDSESYNGTDWESSSVSTYTYNGINKLLIELHKVWEGDELLDSRKHEYVYDGNENLVNKKSYYGNNGVLVLSSDETNTFDTNGLMSSFTHPFIDSTGLQFEFVDFPYINKIISTSYSDQRITYNYGESTADINDYKVANFKAYPNPTNGNVFLETTELQKVDVFNILGKKLFSSKQSQIDLTSFSNGIYLLKVYIKNGKTFTKKIIKN